MAIDISNAIRKINYNLQLPRASKTHEMNGKKSLTFHSLMLDCICININFCTNALSSVHWMSAGGFYNCINSKIIGSKSYLHTFQMGMGRASGMQTCMQIHKIKMHFQFISFRFHWNISRWYVINRRICLIFNVDLILLRETIVCSAELISALYCCEVETTHRLRAVTKRVNGWVKKNSHMHFRYQSKYFHSRSRY